MKITYLEHSGFTIEHEDVVMIFDYYKGRLPDIPAEKKVYVFASHGHYDHFKRKIFRWSDAYENVKYILSSDITDRGPKGRTIYLEPRKEIELDGMKIRTLRSTDEGVAFFVRFKEMTIFHAGDLNWWHWEGEDPVWNRNMEADFRRYAEPLRGRKIDLAMLPLDPRLGEDGFRGPRYFLELADIRRFLRMHQWGNFNFTNQFLSCYTSFTSRTVYVNRVGQVFTFEEEADT